MEKVKEEVDEETVEQKALAELRVVDLRGQLELRGLDKTGVKAVLVDRLEQSLRGEGADPATHLFLIGAEGGKRGRRAARSADDVDEPTAAADDAADHEAATENGDTLKEDISGDSLGDFLLQDDEFVGADANAELATADLDADAEESDLAFPQPDDVAPQCEFTAEDTVLLHQAAHQHAAVDSASMIVQCGDDSADSTVDAAAGAKSLSDGAPDEAAAAAADESAVEASVDASTAAAAADDDDEPPPPSPLQGDAAAEEPAESAEHDDDRSVELIYENESGDAGAKTENDADETQQSDAKEAVDEEKVPPAKQQKSPPKKLNKSSIVNSKNLWVSGLTNEARAADLKTLFSKYGHVSAAKIVVSQKPPLRYYGFVVMSSAAEASKCVQHIHRTELKGKVISVERAASDQQPPQGPAAQQRGAAAIKRAPFRRGGASSATASKSKASSNEPPEKQRKRSPSSSSRHSDADDRRARSEKRAKPRPRDHGDSKSSTERDRRPHHSSSSALHSRLRGRGSSIRRPLMVRRPLARQQALRIAPAATPQPLMRLNTRGGFVRPLRRPRFAPHISESRGGGLRRPEIWAERREREKAEALLADMKKREEKYRVREESLRLQREKERLRFEREKLEREKLELQQLRLAQQQQTLGYGGGLGAYSVGGRRSLDLGGAGLFSGGGMGALSGLDVDFSVSGRRATDFGDTSARQPNRSYGESRSYGSTREGSREERERSSRHSSSRQQTDDRRDSRRADSASRHGRYEERPTRETHAKPYARATRRADFSYRGGGRSSFGRGANRDAERSGGRSYAGGGSVGRRSEGGTWGAPAVRGGRGGSAYGLVSPGRGGGYGAQSSGGGGGGFQSFATSAAGSHLAAAASAWSQPRSSFGAQSFGNSGSMGWGSNLMGSSSGDGGDRFDAYQYAGSGGRR